MITYMINICKRNYNYIYIRNYMIIYTFCNVHNFKSNMSLSNN